MYIYLLLFALLGCSSSSEEAQYGPKDPALGQECDPPHGYARRICGRQTVVNWTSVTVPDFLYGPNACMVTEDFVTKELVYKFKNYCDWVVYGYGQYYYQCTPFCMPTSTCSDRNRTLQRHNVECCDGFTSRKRGSGGMSDHYEYLYDTFYLPEEKKLPEGCPVAVAPGVEGCMALLGLTEFRMLYNMSRVKGMLNFSEMPFTFFVPTNAALASLQISNLDLDMFVGNHIVNGTVKLNDLTLNRQFVTRSGERIHSTAVVFADRTLFQYTREYKQNSHSYQPNPVRYTNVRFINGARVVNPDACMSANVTLHVIDRVLMPAQMTLARILRNRPDLSKFTEALEFANVLDFLDKDGESRTVFAPTNDAFNEQIPPDLFVCLMYKRLPLHDIVLYHIVGSTEYTSSLAVRSGLHTLQLSTFRLSANDSGDITILTDPPATIVVPNIPASNGVLQIIDKVLIPPNFNARACASFLPTEPPQTSSMVVSTTPSVAVTSMSVDDIVPTETASIMTTMDDDYTMTTEAASIMTTEAASIMTTEAASIMTTMDDDDTMTTMDDIMATTPVSARTSIGNIENNP